MPLVTLEAFLDDIIQQPEWRPTSDMAGDYYDGNQLSPEVKAAMKERGQPILIHNLIAPAIDGVLGMEVRTRTDWTVRADDDEGLEVAEGLNELLHEAARLTLADRACADAYAAQVKTGLGWVEVKHGKKTVTNAVMRTKANVVLSDIFNTPGYRQQVSNRLLELTGQLPEQYQGVMLDLLIDATDIPQRDEISKRIRQLTGQGLDENEMTDEQLAQREQQQALEQKQIELQMAEVEGKIAKLQSETRRNNATAEKAEADASLVPVEIEKREAETERILAEMKKVATEIVDLRRRQRSNIDEQVANEDLRSKRLTNQVNAANAMQNLVAATPQ